MDPTEAELQAIRNLNDAGAWVGGWGLCLRTQPGSERYTHIGSRIVSLLWDTLVGHSCGTLL